MVTLRLPAAADVKRFLEFQQSLPFSYMESCATQSLRTIPGFDNDRLRVCIGRGAADFERAKMAVRGWKMFPAGWTKILPENAPLLPGVAVAIYARFLGAWWHNACRIVYVVDAPDRFGFAYGTLPGHVECGEELFQVEIDPENNVWYEIRAFSRPRHWLAKYGYPLVRLLQARFRRDSARQMRAFVQQYSAKC